MLVISKGIGIPALPYDLPKSSKLRTGRGLLPDSSATTSQVSPVDPWSNTGSGSEGSSRSVGDLQAATREGAQKEAPWTADIESDPLVFTVKVPELSC